MTEQFDAIVIGAGHAGCEAALALARLSCKTALFTVSVDSIAMMPCNPNVGGTSKGHLVREIDALGGEMGKNIDRTFIQSKMLNQSKGPAVHSLRAQADKKEYSYAMRKVIEETDGVSIKQGEITDIIRWKSIWRQILYWSDLSMQSCCIMYRYLFECEMYYRRNFCLHRTKWTSVSNASYRFIKKTWYFYASV